MQLQRHAYYYIRPYLSNIHCLYCIILAGPQPSPLTWWRQAWIPPNPISTRRRPTPNAGELHRRRGQFSVAAHDIVQEAFCHRVLAGGNAFV